MTQIPQSLRLLFETDIEETDDGYVIPIPSDLVENGSLTVGETYRLAVLAAAGQETTQSTTSAAPRSNGSNTNTAPDGRGPPVEEGDVRSVTIDTLGDQGDGIARVERGFILIVPGTQPGDQVEVEITDVKESVAFADPVSEPTVR